MQTCKKCGEQLMSAELMKCRSCIIEQHEQVIQTLVETVNMNEKRQLNVIHTEVRQRMEDDQ